MARFEFTTGISPLPDVGELSYNKCVFSPLFHTDVKAVFVKDEAGRTTKLIEYTITADGYVTKLPELLAPNATVEDPLRNLENQLSAHGGELKYTGRGIRIEVNTGGDSDVAWGPVPEVLDITPMGGGGSAHVVWRVVTRIAPRVPQLRELPVLQFNVETTVTYDDAGYSTLAQKGTLEIPLTRANQIDRTLPRTVDDFRDRWIGSLTDRIDLLRFRVTRREFNVSRDKRTMDFILVVEELPWMDMPPFITKATGQFSFRPVKQGMGLATWLCTLTATYTVPKDQPRRIAWEAFLALMRHRMQIGNSLAVVPPPDNNILPPAITILSPIIFQVLIATNVYNAINRALSRPTTSNKVFLVDFSGQEGIYLDSKTMTFSATWRLVTTFDRILVASGLWRKVDGEVYNGNAWSMSIKNIMGPSSWLDNRLDHKADAIVDFGSANPP